ncbi:dTDP-glucose 4,6-dehydratase [Desulfothermobacter acidiphilus]|uniref:dTDP-glucose 4,6-dehydratase n=1 Tax=Desulfothermobacter acidiphilus TaxID=1938353 RepID=UPI003F8B2836
MDKVRLLVTGGAGFIGSNFVRYILQKYPDWEVLNLDKLTYAGNLDNLRDVESLPGYRFVQGDIADPGLVEELMAGGWDAVVNFAAETHVDRSIADSSPFVRTNVEGVRVLLEAARRHKIPLFLQVSTDEVYGSLREKDPPFTESSPLLPNSPYAASKAAADLLCRAYHRTYGLPVIITRCSNNFGPYQFPEKLIPLAVTNLLEGKPVPVYGDGRNIRDWIYVEDHCRALELVLLKGRPGDIYNIGGGQEMRNLELLKEILRLLGKGEEYLVFVPDRPGHDWRYALDSSKIERELGFERKHTFAEALRRTVKWYVENEWWWRPLKERGFGRVNS